MTPSSAAHDKHINLLNGGTATLSAVQGAVDVLETSPGDMVRQPLAAAGNPLAGCDYRSIANHFDPERKLAEPMGGGAGRKMATKPAFLAYLRQVLTEGA